jgi:hypothetical protein
VGSGFVSYNIDTRGAEPGDDQVAPLEERVAGERRQCRRTGVPTEMVERVALVGHRHRVDDLAECGRAGLHVDHRERVGLREVGAEQQSVGEVFRRSFHRKLRGCVEGRIRPHCHWCSPLFASRRPLMWARVRFSEQPELITKERQVSSIEAKLGAAQKVLMQFRFRDFS